jgi:hypothetical protein
MMLHSRARRRLALAASALAWPLAGWANTGVPDDQLWTELDLIAPVAKDMTLTGLAQARFSEELSNPTFSALGADLTYKDGEWSIAAGYRHQVTGHKTDEPKVTQLALLMGTYAPRFGRSTVLIRFRVENTITATSNPWRIRMRAEYRWATEQLGPVTYLFVNDEVYYQFQQSEWYRNRFQVGSNLKLSKSANLLLYFQRQDDKLNHPGAINALCLTGKIAF